MASKTSSNTLLETARGVVQGKSPLKAVSSAGAEKLGGAVKDLLGNNGHDSQNGESDKRKTVNIVEQIDVGVPRSVAYNQWTQFEQFGRFSQAVKEADQKDDAMVSWRAKIAFATRTWKSQITEQLPDQRIAWTSTGDKGTVDGVVTFHELAPDLTRILVDLDYHPKGFVEKTGNLFRAQGRRVRLDLKKFRVFVMARGEETGSWRGEINDGKAGGTDKSKGSGSQSRSRNGRARSNGATKSPARS